MTHSWEPGTQYNLGDVVSFEGSNYKIIQPHRSQGDWTPTVTPALWGRIPGGHGAPQQGHCAPQPPHCAPQPSHCAPQQHGGQQHNNDNNNNHNSQAPISAQKPSEHQGSGRKNDSNSEGEGEKKWYKDPKKLAGIAGGLLGGAALVGAGVAAYKVYDRKKDQKEWLEAAQAHTAAVRSGNVSGPVNWILQEGKDIPYNAIAGGRENNGILYVARGFHKESTTPGKASPALKTGAVIGYDDKEINLEKYEILVGDSRAVQWVAASGRLNVASLGIRPVQGGVDTDGKQLYVARATVNGSVHPGKIAEGFTTAFIPYGGKEEEVSNYEILAYN